MCKRSQGDAENFKGWQTLFQKDGLAFGQRLKPGEPEVIKDSQSWRRIAACRAFVFLLTHSLLLLPNTIIYHHNSKRSQPTKFHYNGQIVPLLALRLNLEFKCTYVGKIRHSRFFLISGLFIYFFLNRNLTFFNGYWLCYRKTFQSDRKIRQKYLTLPSVHSDNKHLVLSTFRKPRGPTE